LKYTSLHHHSTFSFLDGYALPESHVRRAEELEMSAIALTEHGNVSSHVQLEKAAKASGVKPIFGCELYTGPIEETKRQQRKNHLTVLAEDQDGYKNLLRLVSRGWAEGFYYEPTVSGGMLADHQRGLIVLSGCQGSLLATSLVGGKNVAPEDASYVRARQVARRFQRSLGGSYYLEVQAFPELEKACQINQAYEELSSELGIPLVVTGDVHYTSPKESEMQQILHNVRGGGKKTMEQQANEWGYDVPLCHPLTDQYVYDRLRATGLSKSAAQQAIDNSSVIAARCNVELPKLETLRYPSDEPGLTLWRKWLEEGWNYRGINALPPAVRGRYRGRLRYEMSIIEGKDFIDYFLVVSDIVKFAKDRGIPVGPARGSAAASLVCYLLRITEVDPLRFPNLVFERFIDTTREDLPDIDLDFAGDRRGEIREYACAKYGEDCVGNIGTVTNYKSKLALDDVARVYRIPAWEVDPVKELLIERSSGDLRASATIEDTAEYFPAAAEVFAKHPDLRKAMDLEGNLKGMGIHAAGLVIASQPLNDAVAIYTRETPKGSGNWVDVISADKYDAEYLNLIKIDALALDTMEMLGLACDMCNMELEDLYAIPLDDPEVLLGFKENDVVGIFQFDGRAQRNVSAELGPENFDEIADVCALARPGPLHSGATAEYIEVARGRKVARHLHPLLDNITKNTHYQIVYQEQILRIVMEIGQFDWTHAAYIRKIISKKIGEQEFNRQWHRFWKGAEAQGITEAIAKEIWNACITAGSYAFNNAHTVSYGMIAYWCMWFKRHHTQEFYVAALAKYGHKENKYKQKKHVELLRDAAKHGIRAEPPEIGLSGVTWSPCGTDGMGVRAGLTQVPGIGYETAKKIVEWRDTKGTFDIGGWYDLKEIKGIGDKMVETIMDFVVKDDPFDIYKLERDIAKVKKEIENGDLGPVPVPTHTALEVPYSQGQDTEVVWLGQIIHRNLRDLFELHYSRTGEVLDPADVRDPGLKDWVVMLGEDGDELLSITVDRWKYPRFKRALWGLHLNKDLVLVRGIKKGNQSRRAIYASQLWVISPD